MKGPHLEINKNKEFHIEFSNGYQIQVRFGSFNYCSRANFDSDRLGEERDMVSVYSQDAEVEIFKDGEWATNEIFNQLNLDNIEGVANVLGYVKPDDVGRIIGFIAEL